MGLRNKNLHLLFQNLDFIKTVKCDIMRRWSFFIEWGGLSLLLLLPLMFLLLYLSLFLLHLHEPWAVVKMNKWEREWLARENEEKRSRKEDRNQHAKQLKVLRNQVI